MISFKCPQCDQALNAEDTHCGIQCKCPKCNGVCVAPVNSGERAEVVYCTSKIFFKALPLTAAAVPPVCICCGRNAVGTPLNVKVWSHEKSVGQAIGSDVAKAAGYLVGGTVGFVVADSLTHPREPICLFDSVPCCGQCPPQATKRLKLLAIEGKRMIVDGVPTRFAAAVEEQFKREAAAFELAATRLVEGNADSLSNSESSEPTPRVNLKVDTPKFAGDRVRPHRIPPVLLLLASLGLGLVGFIVGVGLTEDLLLGQVAAYNKYWALIGGGLIGLLLAAIPAIFWKRK